MALPFLKLKPNEDESDIDLCWDGLKSERADLGETDSKKLDQFTEYCETTWLNSSAMFLREIWNLHDNIFHRSNNISENKSINQILISRAVKFTLLYTLPNFAPHFV
jgi:hypothetical protein